MATLKRSLILRFLSLCKKPSWFVTCSSAISLSDKYLPLAWLHQCVVIWSDNSSLLFHWSPNLDDEVRLLTATENNSRLAIRGSYHSLDLSVLPYLPLIKSSVITDLHSSLRFSPADFSELWNCADLAIFLLNILM